MNLQLVRLIAPRESIAVDAHFIATFGHAPAATIQIVNERVGDLHGEFYAMQGQLMLRDLGCEFGTQLNGVDVSTEVALQEGDVISAGQVPLFSVVSASKAVVPQGHPASPEHPQHLAKHQTSALATGRQSPEQPSQTGGFKMSPLLWVAVTLTLVLVATAVLKPKPEPVADVKVAVHDYAHQLDVAVRNFRQQDYEKVSQDMRALIHRFDQNHAAHVLSELAEIWKERGPRYGNLDWKKAEDLSRELINVHPSSDKVKKLGQSLLEWVLKEEPNMAVAQQALIQMKKGLWEQAYLTFESIPKDSRFHQLFLEDHQEALANWIKSLEQTMLEHEHKQDWPKALGVLEVLLGLEDRIAWQSKQRRWMEYIEDHKTFNEGQQAYERKDYDLVLELLTHFPDDAPDAPRAKALVLTATKEKWLLERERYFDQGQGDQAILISEQHFPEDISFVKHVRKVIELYEHAQVMLGSKSPEKVVIPTETLISLEPDEENHYVVQANRWHRQWSSPRQLGDLFIERAKNAYEKGDYSVALNHYLKAESYGSLDAMDSIKAMEKQANSYYNKAMSFAIKDDMGNVKAYLRKALALLPQGHKLRDRIELYVRRNLK